jgi:putative hydroxymethylpyrimidine transport system substrate-binding protein
MRRALAVAAALTLMLAALAGCGEKKDPVAAVGNTQRLTLMLDYLPNADHVGIYESLAAGDFRQAGIDISVQTPSDPSAPLKLLEAGKVDLAISYEPELLLARDRGARLVSVAALVQKPLTSIISLSSKKIASVANLRGKRIGTAGIPYQHAYLQTILDRAGVPRSSVHETNVGFNLVPAMLSGKVDATLGGYWNVEAVQLALAHKRPRVIRMDAVGVPTYDELVIVARQQTLSDRGDAIRAFVQALGRGTAQARQNPQGAVDALVRQNPDLDRKLQLASVRATLPVLFPTDATKPFGWQDPAAWNAYGQWMLDQRLLSSPPNAANALTDEFLAGQGT